MNLIGGCIFGIAVLISVVFAATDPCSSKPCDPRATCKADASAKQGYTCTCPALYLGNGNFCVADHGRRTKCNGNWNSWRCDDGSCIPLKWVTDDVKDCRNGEDEDCDISSKRIRCGKRCYYVDEVEKKCKPKKLYDRMFCDYYNYVSFECHDKKKCVPCGWVKDGECQCDDCSDENDASVTAAGCDYYYYYY